MRSSNVEHFRSDRYLYQRQPAKGDKHADENITWLIFLSPVMGGHEGMPCDVFGSTEGR